VKGARLFADPFHQFRGLGALMRAMSSWYFSSTPSVLLTISGLERHGVQRSSARVHSIVSGDTRSL